MGIALGAEDEGLWAHAELAPMRDSPEQAGADGVHVERRTERVHLHSAAIIGHQCPS